MPGEFKEQCGGQWRSSQKEYEMRTEGTRSQTASVSQCLKDNEFLSDDLGKRGRILIQRDRKPDLLLFVSMSIPHCLCISGGPGGLLTSTWPTGVGAQQAVHG